MTDPVERLKDQDIDGVHAEVLYTTLGMTLFGLHDADRIELRGLRSIGTHGVLAEEQARAQPFEVDLELEADLTVAGRSDDLIDTVDYGSLAERVAA